MALWAEGKHARRNCVVEGWADLLGAHRVSPWSPWPQDGCHIPVSMLHVAQGGRHAVTPSYRVTHGYCYNFYRRHGVSSMVHMIQTTCTRPGYWEFTFNILDALYCSFQLKEISYTSNFGVLVLQHLVLQWLIFWWTWLSKIIWLRGTHFHTLGANLKVILPSPFIMGAN